MNTEDAREILRLIFLAYPNFEISKEKIELWAELLGDLDYESTVKAVKNYIKNNKYPPTIADIREIVSQQRRVVYR